MVAAHIQLSQVQELCHAVQVFKLVVGGIDTAEVGQMAPRGEAGEAILVCAQYTKLRWASVQIFDGVVVNVQDRERRTVFFKAMQRSETFPADVESLDFVPTEFAARSVGDGLDQLLIVKRE